MLTINTNLSSLIVQSNLKTSTNGLNNAIERMTTGFKLNHAKDNAANYSISTSLTTKLGAYTVAEENAMMGLDMVQTASSSLSQMSDLASRLRSLAMQAQNGTYGSTSLDALNSEANAIVKELFRIQNTTQYNGINLLNGGTSTNIATNAVATLSSASTSTQSSPRATSSGFIEAVQKRDTSAMTTLASVDENTTLDSGTYSISTAEELAKLATMTNNGKVTGNAEFVLANDIDLSAYRENGGWTPIGNLSNSFSGTFDGNGYKIKNLYIKYDERDAGLFGVVVDTEIKNVGIENIDITTWDFSGGIVASANSSIKMDNCYTTGSIINSYVAGGLLGTAAAAETTINACYSSCNIVGNSADESMCAGGLVGEGVFAILQINNSYSLGSVFGYNAGGLLGISYAQNFEITNSYSVGNVNGIGGVGGLVGSHAAANTSAIFDNAYFLESTGQTSGIGAGNEPTSGSAKLITKNEYKDLVAQGILYSYLAPDFETTLQVGINDTEQDTLGISIPQVDIFLLQGLSITSNSALKTIDSVMQSINEQQTSLGAVENRLMSAIESIGVNINNLTSTRSTIKDADVAELSSEYIRNQILQQASATLLATANQNPSIALQLI